MKQLIFTLLIMTLCATPSHAKDEAKLIEKSDFKVQNGVMTPEALWAFGRVGDVSVSPNGKKVLYSVRYYSVEQNKSNADLYMMNADGSGVQRLTQTAKSEGSPAFSSDGQHIGFTYADKDGNDQFFEMTLDGQDRKQISSIDGGIEGFKYAPDGQHILYIKTVKKENPQAKLFAGLDKTTGRVNEDLMYRHWDDWVDSYPHPFVADFDGSKLSNDTDLLQGTPFESPMRPMGGVEQLAWSPDGKKIAYTCRKKVGKAYALSTNSDIYLYDIAAKTTENISEGMMGYDINPVFSPDGKKIAWESMEHDGYESDKSRLMVYDFATKTAKDYTQKLDQSVHNICWSKDNSKLYFISPFHGVEDIFVADVKTNAIRRVTEGVHDYLSIDLAGKNLIGSRQSMSAPTEIFSINPADGKETQISFENKDLMAQLKIANVEGRWIKTTDNKDMLTWVIYPPNFDKNKKYPTLLFCEGGPQSMVSQFWSYRWNMQIMAANGYIVVAPNRRGLPGFGQEWLEQISGDYGGQNMKDYLSAIDALAKESYVDKDHLGCVGASYGGFSVYWLAGHHDKRFKAFLSHDGIFNLEQQYCETEEMWFVNWDLGGAYWDKNNPTAQRSYANSPHRFVDKWDTPLMVVHSEKDYRIVASQGMAAYNAALLKGLPARYLYFPDENHWVTKPQNGILWQRTFFDWLDKWLKTPENSK